MKRLCVVCVQVFQDYEFVFRESQGNCWWPTVEGLEADRGNHQASYYTRMSGPMVFRSTGGAWDIYQVGKGLLSKEELTSGRRSFQAIDF